MARETGLHPTTISRIWRAHGLKPHRIKTFKLSKDPNFVEKLQAVIGLYLNPPERAVVFSVDEKSQIQALDRTQPGLPLKKGRAGTMTHDYKRHGTTTLFAALNVRTGSVIHECLPRHRAAEFLRFARKVVREVPKDLDVYFILDNASTHRTPEVMRWLQRNPRVSFYFVPTSSSWANQVERLFSELQVDRELRRHPREGPEGERDFGCTTLGATVPLRIGPDTSRGVLAVPPRAGALGDHLRTQGVSAWRQPRTRLKDRVSALPTHLIHRTSGAAGTQYRAGSHA